MASSRERVMAEMYAVYGHGPEGAKCRDCDHLSNTQYHGGRYPKCDLRKMSRCTATDHWTTTAACGRFTTPTREETT